MPLYQVGDLYILDDGIELQTLRLDTLASDVILPLHSYFAEFDVRNVHLSPDIIRLVFFDFNVIPVHLMRPTNFLLHQPSFFDIVSYQRMLLGNRNLFIKAVLFILQLFDAVFHHEFLKDVIH